MNASHAKQMKILTAAQIGLHESLIARQEMEEARLTCSMLIVAQKSAVLLVRSKVGQNWIAPQGKIKTTDKTLTLGARREAFEEVGFEDRHRSSEYDILVGQYRNPIPRNRQESCKEKLIVCVGMTATRDSFVRLNDDNERHEWVSSPSQLAELMSTTRKIKREGTFAALHRLFERKILNWTPFAGQLATQ